MKTVFGLLTITILLLLLGVLLAVRLDKVRNVQSIEQSFALLEQYHVYAYRNQNWCKNMYYDRGAFSDNTASTCNLFMPTPQPFDVQATTDFDKIAQALSHTSVNIITANVAFNSLGKVQDAQFTVHCYLCTCIFCESPKYIFMPQYENLPEGDPSEMWYTKINQDWYMVEAK